MKPITAKTDGTTFTVAELSEPYEDEGGWYLQERSGPNWHMTIWGPASFEMITALLAERRAHYLKMIENATSALRVSRLTEGPP